MTPEFIHELQNAELRWLGLTDYEQALKAQIEAADAVRAGGPAVILACEHPTVITLGKRGQALTDILASMDLLRAQNIAIVGTDRGGQATLHNPGQLVLYPILPLRRWHFKVRDYVECLERATAIYLAEYGMEVTRGYEPGLFVESKKIAAFGIRVDRGVSLHGVAINLRNDTEQFSLIRQCGQSLPATNLALEMTTFTSNVPLWDFADEAQHWFELFREEAVEALTGWTKDEPVVVAEPAQLAEPPQQDSTLATQTLSPSNIDQGALPIAANEITADEATAGEGAIEPAATEVNAATEVAAILEAPAENAAEPSARAIESPEHDVAGDLIPEAPNEAVAADKSL